MRALTCLLALLSSVYIFDARAAGAALSLGSPPQASCTTPLPASSGRTLYVSPRGNDSGSGALRSPFKTLAKAVSMLRPGDTLILMDGVYDDVLRDIPSGTSWENRVTIKAQNFRRAILRPTTCLKRGAATILNFPGGDAFIEVNGLVMDGANRCAGIVSFRGPGGVDPGKDTHHIRLINNELMNASGTRGTGMIAGGHQGTSRTHHIEILNNYLHHMGGGSDPARSGHNHCIYFKADDSLIEGNHIHHCAGSGMTFHQSGAGAQANNITVRNNYIHDMVAGPCIRLVGKNHTASSNVCRNAGSPSYAPLMIALGGPDNSKFLNNVVIGGRSSLGCIVVSSGSNIARNSQVGNNICAGGVNDRILDQGMNSQIANNLCSGSGCSMRGTPQFINAAAGDYRLAPDSAAAWAGIGLTASSCQASASTAMSAR